jgi:hypothetical protein
VVGQGRLHPLGSSGPGAGSTRSLTQLNTHSGSITSATKHPPSHPQTISRPIISKLFGWLVNSSAVSIFTELTFQYPLPASSLALTPKSNSNPHCSHSSCRAWWRSATCCGDSHPATPRRSPWHPGKTNNATSKYPRGWDDDATIKTAVEPISSLIAVITEPLTADQHCRHGRLPSQDSRH